MAWVYVSSTTVDLEAERNAVFAWLRQRGHEGVQSYVADSDTVCNSCVADVASTWWRQPWAMGQAGAGGSREGAQRPDDRRA
jgi:Domain of unknown function (DUF4062)